MSTTDYNKAAGIRIPEIKNIKRGLIVAGFIGALIPSSVVGVNFIGDRSNAIKLESQLEQDGPKAVDSYFKGDLQDKPVQGVDLTGYTSPADAAQSIAKQGHVLQVQYILSGQAGDTLQGSHGYGVLPKSAINNEVAVEVDPIPQDKNIHVG